MARARYARARERERARVRGQANDADDVDVGALRRGVAAAPGRREEGGGGWGAMHSCTCQPLTSAKTAQRAYAHPSWPPTAQLMCFGSAVWMHQSWNLCVRPCCCAPRWCACANAYRYRARTTLRSRTCSAPIDIVRAPWSLHERPPSLSGGRGTRGRPACAAASIRTRVRGSDKRAGSSRVHVLAGSVAAASCAREKCKW